MRKGLEHTHDGLPSGSIGIRRTHDLCHSGCNVSDVRSFEGLALLNTTPKKECWDMRVVGKDRPVCGSCASIVDPARLRNQEDIAGVPWPMAPNKSLHQWVRGSQGRCIASGHGPIQSRFCGTALCHHTGHLASVPTTAVNQSMVQKELVVALSEDPGR